MTLQLNHKTWECVLCRTEYPNTLLYCPKCEVARKHSENVRESLGIDAVARCKTPITDDRTKRSGVLERHKKLLQEYEACKTLVQQGLMKLFRLADDLNLGVDKLGFCEFEYMYVVKRWGRNDD